ncbi:MAG: HigA family addiction module antidote protein [Geminicoccaceae bacterium]|nr:HigA family addiction module antidote protein [Geminicoccaceae bacterium]
MTNESLPVEAPMKNPPHPGRIVRQDCIEALGLTIGEAAEAPGVTRQTVDRLVHERGGVSPEMALRLAKAFAAPRRCGCACRQRSIWQKRARPRSTNSRTSIILTLRTISRTCSRITLSAIRTFSI